jgi:UDP:flavonoid glycosyltransferase YjiC (YdhE family)
MWPHFAEGSTMHISVIAPGSRGDVEPYLALAQGLGRAGHHARLVTHQNFEGLVTTHGVEFWPLEGSVQAIAQSEDMRARLEGGNFLAIMGQMAREAQRGALALAKGGLAACRDTDVIIAGIGGLFTGIALAEKFGLPLVQAYYIPFTPTAAYPSFLAPSLRGAQIGRVNRLSYHAARQMIWQGFRSADTLARRDVLGLPRAPLSGPFNSHCLRGQPILYGYSQRVIPRPADWDAQTHVTGYWFVDGNDAWQPPQAVLDFLAAGPPPVYVGFGSMSSRNPEETTALVVQALAQARQRGLVLAGWGGMGSGDLPETILAVDSVPFAWLFPRVTAVVHHGGAGTTAAGLRAGVPSVIVPFFGDQPFWGRRVADLGVGPQPIPRRKLTVERLAQAISQAVTDQAMRQRAAALGAVIQTEDGVARAVDIVEQSVQRRAAWELHQGIAF